MVGRRGTHHSPHRHARTTAVSAAISAQRRRRVDKLRQRKLRVLVAHGVSPTSAVFVHCVNNDVESFVSVVVDGGG